jgi:peptidyl-prolyl cis-trans isomerase D
VRLSDQEVLDEYKMQNEKVQVEGILVKSAAFTDKVTMTDDEVAKYYDTHKEAFKTPDRVKIQYLYFDPQRFKADVNPTEEDIKQYYTDHESEYNKGKEVKARHILFRLAKDADQATEATVKQKAEDVLQKLKAGADFAELAKQYSEDPGTAKNGGDLGFFSKGMMVPEFEEKAFAMNPGDISDLIRTDYGYHILKVDETREEPDPYSKAKPVILELLKMQGSHERVVQQMEASYQDLLKTKDLQKIAANTGTEVRVSQFFAQGEPLDEKTQAIPQVQEAAFALSAEDKFSEPIETPLGYYIVEFLESKPSYIPELKDITEQVQTALRKEKAKDLAKAEAQTVEADLKNGADWEAVIQKYTLEKLAPEPFSRRQNYLAEFPGKAAEVIKIAFGLKEGERSAVVELPENYCLIRMVKKTGIDAAKFTTEKDTLKKQLLQQKQNQVFQDFVEELKQKADIKISDRMAG